MSYMNRPHSAELTQSLKNHGMDIKRPSQLSDAFRLGWWAAEKEAKQQRAELLEALQKLHSVALGSVELDDWRELQDALDCAMQAITNSEAAA